MEETDMNADERTPGQQGENENQLTGRQQQQTEQQPSTGQGVSASTGQASYGNSGETDADTLSQNSTSLGQDSDLGQSNQTGQAGQTGQSSDSGLFSGSNDDLGTSSAGTGRTGIEGSIDDPNLSDKDLGGSTGRSGIDGSLDEADQQTPRDQDFADQGQGALNEDAMGSAKDRGTTDIEAERSQGRESDIEGSSL